MRAVIQRVEHASVEVDGEIRARMGRGLLVLLGAIAGDGDAEVRWMSAKVAELRVFPDERGRMNRSVAEAGGGVLVVPNFTLAADCRRGRRPAFDAALDPSLARPLVDRVADAIAARGVAVQRGVFGAHMRVELLNDGPVTLVIDSP